MPVDAQEPDEPENVDLSPIEPSERADPAIVNEANFKGPGGFTFSASSRTPASGLAGAASAVFLLSLAGLVPALAVGVLAAFISTSSWVSLISSAGIFCVVFIVGLILVFRRPQ